MQRKPKLSQSPDRRPKLTTLEQGLKDAILESDRAKRAFRNLAVHGFDEDCLIIQLTLWARSPEVLFSYSSRSDLPTRDVKRAYERFALKLRTVADELAGNKFCKKLVDPRSLQLSRVVEENGGSEMVHHLGQLPQTLRLYSRILTRTLLIENRYARHDKTLNEHRAEFTRVFFDSVKASTQKDRIDSVVILFNLASQHFGLEESFEKRALTAQLKRLRRKTQASQSAAADRKGILSRPRIPANVIF